MLSPMINANFKCSFCFVEGLLLVLDVSSLISSHFVLFDGFSLIVFEVSLWVSIFFSIFCVLLHCIVFSAVLLDGIVSYVFWLPVQYYVLRYFISILFFSFNSSQPRFSFFRSVYFCVNSCVEIRLEMS